MPARLLSGAPTRTSFAIHVRTVGARPRFQRAAGAEFISLLEASGLRGRGGSGFPTARKWRAVRDATKRRPPIIVANGSEGEPASHKDRLLMRQRPHLIIDGLLIAAEALGAEDTCLVVPREFTEESGSLRAALAERSDIDDAITVEVVEAPHRYIAGESSAVVSFLNGKDARPTFSATTHTADSGVNGQPTLLQNVETLAHIALIARHGYAWFRQLGTEDSPGTMLLTVHGAVHHPGVIEVPMGVSLAEVIGLCGGPSGPIRASLVGGYFGAWLSIEQCRTATLDHASMKRDGGGVGCGVVAFLGPASCGLAETSGIVNFLARESAQQCGPCFRGLPAIAERLTAVTEGGASPEDVVQLRAWIEMIRGRGACRHPDGALMLTTSALNTFAADVLEHLDGRPCAGWRQPRLLPTPVHEQVWQ